MPACGFDSVPSDISAHLANKTLKSLGPSSTGEYFGAGNSLSSQAMSGGISGGTVASMMTALEVTPKHLIRQSKLPYAISPIVGIRPAFRLLYDLPIPGAKTLRGAIFFMAPSNRAVVQRSFGLLALQAIESKGQCYRIPHHGI